ncbi:MAG: hypothetical protein KDD64_13775 [Bdellovibrionales bacterium]|nr:hypothetical protein [Bdellovibrionales bacterium]
MLKLLETLPDLRSVRLPSRSDHLTPNQIHAITKRELPVAMEQLAKSRVRVVENILDFLLALPTINLGAGVDAFRRLGIGSRMLDANSLYMNLIRELSRRRADDPPTISDRKSFVRKIDQLNAPFPSYTQRDLTSINRGNSAAKVVSFIADFFCEHVVERSTIYHEAFFWACRYDSQSGHFAHPEFGEDFGPIILNAMLMQDRPGEGLVAITGDQQFEGAIQSAVNQYRAYLTAVDKAAETLVGVRAKIEFGTLFLDEESAIEES